MTVSSEIGWNILSRFKLLNLNNFQFHNNSLISFLLFTVVTTELTQSVIRRPESVGTVQICATKDLETARPLDVTFQTFDGTAMSKIYTYYSAYTSMLSLLCLALIVYRSDRLCRRYFYPLSFY